MDKWYQGSSERRWYQVHGKKKFRVV